MDTQVRLIDLIGKPSGDQVMWNIKNTSGYIDDLYYLGYGAVFGPGNMCLRHAKATFSTLVRLFFAIGSRLYLGSKNKADPRTENKK